MSSRKARKPEEQQIGDGTEPSGGVATFDPSDLESEPTAQATATEVQPNQAPPRERYAPRRGGFTERFKRPDTLGVSADSGTVVHLVDFGNKYGIGIQVDLPDGRKPTPEEIEVIRRVVKGEEGEETGFHWDKPKHLKNDQSVPKMWFKSIDRNPDQPAPAKVAVAIRMDAEARVNQLAEDLKELHQDPTGFAERIRLEREQGGADRIPD